MGGEGHIECVRCWPRERGGKGNSSCVDLYLGGRSVCVRVLQERERRVVAAEAVSGKSGGVGELHCQRAAAADKSRCGWGESYKEGGALFVTLQAAILCAAQYWN